MSSRLIVHGFIVAPDGARAGFTRVLEDLRLHQAPGSNHAAHGRERVTDRALQELIDWLR